VREGEKERVRVRGAAEVQISVRWDMKGKERIG
jgi:hypothetical protein